MHRRSEADLSGKETLPPEKEIHPDKAERSTIIHFRVFIKDNLRGISFFKGFDQGNVVFQGDLGVGD
ncbi:MAG: hypothetical protein HFI16_04650 [Lachnospiraceae bacterium]|nr:hypothetical protein [Lachnospiraceae bacterium]